MQRTLFLLMFEFESGVAPLEDVAMKYFKHDRKKMLREARESNYPFPVFKGSDSQKSEWMVSVQELAIYLDKRAQEAKSEFIKLTG